MYRDQSIELGPFKRKVEITSIGTLQTARLAPVFISLLLEQCEMTAGWSSTFFVFLVAAFLPFYPQPSVGSLKAVEPRHFGQ